MPSHNAHEEVNAQRDELIAQAARYADLGLGVHAEMLRQGGPMPESLEHFPN
jgi:hypothetical protein